MRHTKRVRKASKFSPRQAALKHGWRSGLEEAVSDSLKRRSFGFEYETLTIPFQQPTKPRKYTPDFILPNGIIVETKGRFLTADRQKMLLVKEQYPELDIRFVFSNANQRISKQSKTTYAVWALTKGFLFAGKDIPSAWLHETHNQQSLAIIRRLTRG